MAMEMAMRMAHDKHKKRDRAYAFLRSLRNRHHEGLAAMPFSGRPTRLMRWCIENGMATIERVACWDRSNTNVFRSKD